MGKAEAKVESYLDDEFTRRGGATYKWVSPGRANVPDRICIIKGIVIFAEVKQFDSDLSSGQARELEKLQNLGCAAFCIAGMKSVDQLMKFVDEQLNSFSLPISKEINQLLH